MTQARPGSRGTETLIVVEVAVVPLLLVLLLVVILFGAGFALKALWWVAVVLFVFWLLGFIARGAHPTGGRRRWYRW